MYHCVYKQPLLSCQHNCRHKSLCPTATTQPLTKHSPTLTVSSSSLQITWSMSAMPARSSQWQLGNAHIVELMST